MGLAIDDWQVAWNPQRNSPGLDKIPGPPANGAVEVGKLSGKWAESYDSARSCEGKTLDEQIAEMFITFHMLVVRDGIDPIKAHRQFLKIDEYRRRIDPEVEGADDGSADL